MLVVGRIGKPHGIRGEVTVEVRTDEPETRFAPGSVLRTEPGANVPAHPGAYRVPGELTVEAARWHQGRVLLVTFEGVLDRNVAEALRGTLVGVDRADVAPPTDPEEFHDHQLVGLAVVTSAGERLGEIARIDHAPAADLLVLRRPGRRDVLIPFVQAIVPEIDLAGGRVVVDPPGGLLDL
ncbi:ribosome maturation factor RimM [Salinispora tropica]|uniref:Ribosome maturation factor RimM n=1 Tax=Salinispora tropica (strain ATCC BAA-916 / DSM 44818 / JCM 13857 / NBRC 105044 / CNB-440) TaxID=369723 RepID=RIMM_SALTO|nr:ribosome maturation factor RimM [Salinispora tropica]A4X4H7.1 RecName: Full=Ribosome maturation factor RimM [Salinispora tropica CNB-440]ABP53777.1 16S rRNA processing protein RimM [Salinispora tropica CNB-440]